MAAACWSAARLNRQQTTDLGWCEVHEVGHVGPVTLFSPCVRLGAESADGSGAVQAPAGAGDVEAVGDQMACGALDGAAGDRPADSEGCVATWPTSSSATARRALRMRLADR